MSEQTETLPPRRGRPPKAAETDEFVASQEVAASDAMESIDRPFMRAPMRADDPRARAAQRTAEIRGHIGDLDQGTDKFRAPPAPAGWTYEWKRKTVAGQEDPAYQIGLARMGWEPVATLRHPEEMPGKGNHPVIERDGMILMERPAEITAEAKRIADRRAKEQVRGKQEQLSRAPTGDSSGGFAADHPQTRAKIKQSYEPIKIPE